MVYFIIFSLVIVTVIVILLVRSSHKKLDSEYSKWFSTNNAVTLWINNSYVFSCEQMKEYLSLHGIHKVDTDYLFSKSNNPLSYKQKKFVLKHKNEILSLYQMYEIDRGVRFELGEKLSYGKRKQYYNSYILSASKGTLRHQSCYSSSIQSPTGETWNITASSYPPKYCVDHIAELDVFVWDKEGERIKTTYPDGFAKFWIEEERSDGEYLMANEDKIKKYDEEIKEERIQLAKWYDNWENSQSKFTAKCRNLRDSKLSNYGCYCYDIDFKKKDSAGKEIPGKYKVWQMFCEEYCSESDLEYNYRPNCHDFYLKLPEFQSQTRFFNKHVYDKILGFIDELVDEIENDDEVSGIAVYFGPSVFSDYSINDYHFSYLKEQLNDRDIRFLNVDEDRNIVSFAKIVIVELVTNNALLRDNCRKLINLKKECRESKSADDWCPRKQHGDKCHTDIVYISLLKEYDRSEMIEIIEEEKEKIEEKKKIEEYIDKYKRLAEDNPNGFKKYFPNLSPNNLSYEDAIEISRKKNKIEDEENRIKQEASRKLKQADLSNRFSRAVSSWSKIGTIPHYFFYWYYPKKWWGDNVSTQAQRVRYMIYSFKDGDDYIDVVDIVGQKLSLTFDKDDLESLVVVGIPASSQGANVNRYENFFSCLKRNYGINNGFSHVWVTSQRNPARLGGTRGVVNYAIDEDWFDGKYVVIFDDIVTKGGSVRQFASILQDAGATVVCALSIGKTFYVGTHGHTPLPDPWVEESQAE